MKRCIVFLAVFFVYGCAKKQAPNKFSDDVLVRIADDQDKRLGDSLYQYFKSPNPQYRAAAALAFASFRDTSASPLLGNLLLEDAEEKVRRNAAFALGQTGGIAAVNSLIPALQDHSSIVLRETLEALGKTIHKADIEILKNYNPADTLTQEGLAWAFCRLAIRGLADSTIVLKNAGLLTQDHSLQTRLGAASFFGRGLVKPEAERNLITAALHDPSAEVRMVAVNGLRKYKSDTVFAALEKILLKEKDYRVRVSLTRALQNFSTEKTKLLFLVLLRDQNKAVGIAASEAILNSLKDPWNQILDEARSNQNERIQANLYKAYLMITPLPAVVQEVETKYGASKNDYQKAWLLGALSQAQDASSFIRDELINSKVFVIQSAAAEALVTINRSKKFSVKRQEEFAGIYKQAIAKGDPAVTGIVCSALSDPDLGYKTSLKNIVFLKQAREKLKLPQDIESLQPLDYAIAYLEGKPKPAPLKNNFNHPINWELVKSIPENQKVMVKTTQGDIILRLWVEEAPGSVANFVDLVRQKYFDHKYFHRVVPNFVIQTGCNRGDGFGSEDYSIRSEFSLRRYTTGSVGMASAGRDTEGTQWFITHSPTPHLDGNYTIFAEVEKGMEAVHQMQVGDQILTVSLIDN